MINQPISFKTDVMDEFCCRCNDPLYGRGNPTVLKNKQGQFIPKWLCEPCCRSICEENEKENKK